MNWLFSTFIILNQAQTNSKLNEVNRNAIQTNQFLAQQSEIARNAHEEGQRIKAHKEMVFTVKKRLEQIQQEIYLDPKYSYYQCYSYLLGLDKNGISSDSFNDFLDKEYYSKTIELGGMIFAECNESLSEGETERIENLVKTDFALPHLTAIEKLWSMYNILPGLPLYYRPFVNGSSCEYNPQSAVPFIKFLFFLIVVLVLCYIFLISYIDYNYGRIYSYIVFWGLNLLVFYIPISGLIYKIRKWMVLSKVKELSSEIGIEFSKIRYREHIPPRIANEERWLEWLGMKTVTDCETVSNVVKKVKSEFNLLSSQLAIPLKVT